ncbi:MAG: response regulator [Deltaproteobacteria bacterium]|nr:response regulator [Deltaproteobacteria bacterium]
MKEAFTILIADKNPHVRKLLKREMMAEGYGIRTAEKGRQVLEMIYRNEPLDLLLLDPDLVDMNGVDLLKKLQDRIPTLPVIVHAFLDDYDKIRMDFIEMTFVEKRGNSIEHLKPVVKKMLWRYFPGRSADL